jgi:quercetin dioxygenase-like cupin family protein
MTTDSAGPVARLVDARAAEILDVLGPTIQHLTPLDGDDIAPCVMRGTIPSGVVVPMHSHPDPETFLVLSGRLEGLQATRDEHAWTAVGPGDVFHVPPNARHAWRNPDDVPAVTIIVSTVKIGRFFREVGAPLVAGGATEWPPPEHALQRLLETCERYGYWNATPEENARVGLGLPA